MGACQDVVEGRTSASGVGQVRCIVAATCRTPSEGAGNPLSGVVAGFYSGVMGDEDTPSEAVTAARPADGYDIP